MKDEKHDVQSKLSHRGNGSICAQTEMRNSWIFCQL